jgi:hypothetical protein
VLTLSIIELTLFTNGIYLRAFSSNALEGVSPTWKANRWLRDEVSVWLGTDPSHKLPTIIWVNESYLREHGVNQSQIASRLVAEYEATVNLIGEPILHCIIADVPAVEIERLGAQPFVESLGSGTYPLIRPRDDMSLQPQASEISYGDTTLATSMASIDAPRAWAMGYRGQGMKIAILDTGINETLPDGNPRPDLLFPNGTSKIIRRQDFTNESDLRDFWGVVGHGTWVAVTAAGSGLYNFSSSSLNVTSEGAAPEAMIMNVKVMAQFGGYPNWTVLGIYYAVQEGADVINISAGVIGGTPTDDLSKAADEAVREGVVVVVSAGNDGPDHYTIGSPGCAFNVTTVGLVVANGTTSIKDDDLHPESSRGPTIDERKKPDVVAPGYRQMMLRYINGSSPDCVLVNGTSFSTPHTAGAAALIRQAHPDWGPLVVKDALRYSARLNDYLCYPFLDENDRGKGIIDAYGAFLNATPADFSVVSVDPLEPQYSVFQVYDSGMWLNGTRITMSCSVTVRREAAYTNPVLLMARVGLKRTRVDIPGEETIIDNNVTLMLTVGEEATRVIVWNETNTMQAGNWTISGFVEPIEGYYDGWPEDDSKNGTTVQAKVLLGDVNGNGIVDIYDAIGLSNCWGKLENQTGYNPHANFNSRPDNRTGLQMIDIYDAIILTSHFGWDIYGPRSPERSGMSPNGGMQAATTGTPCVVVDPGQIIAFKGEVFTVNVKVTGVTDLYGWEFKLYWNNNVLNCTNAVIQTPTEWQSNAQNYGPGLEANYNVTYSRYWMAQSADYPALSFNGSMTMVTLTFQAMQPGTTSLTLADTKLGNSTGDPIDHTDSSGSVSVYHGRYMRGDTKTVNSLNAYLLNATRTTSSLYQSVNANGQEPVTWGIRAWVRHSNGTEQEITLNGQTGTPKAQVSRSSGYGMQSNTVSVTQRNMQATDSLVVRVYMDIGGGGWTQAATFTTEQLGATTLTGTTWTVYYYSWATYNRITDKTYGRYYWGSPAYDSRIQNLQCS